jgi:hypothetical protein
VINPDVINTAGTAAWGGRVQGRMTVRGIAVLLAASAALALAGCAGSASQPIAGTGTAVGSAVASASASPEPSTEPSAGRPTAKGGETLTGTISAGVEPGCLILQGPDSHHVLVFDDPALRAEAKVGATVTVTGRAEPTQLTTCQQGVPFIVTAVRAN